jgi:sugar phosphate isomerase/epimerase
MDCLRSAATSGSTTGERGSSDPIEPDEERLVETVVDEMVAVADEVGCERVVVLSALAPAPALQFAATIPGGRAPWC